MHTHRPATEYVVQNGILIVYLPSVLGENFSVQAVLDEITFKTEMNSLKKVLINCEATEVAYTRLNELLVKLERINLEEARGLDIRLCSLEQRIQDLLKSTNVLSLHDFYPDQNTALAAF